MRSVEGIVLKPGMIVRLTNPNPRYILGPANPAEGTEWECLGEFVGGSSVKWQNGTSNSYSNDELSVFHIPEGTQIEIEESPFASNVSKCISIW